MEPSLSQMDDYNGNESKEKRNTVNAIIGLLLALGLGYTLVKNVLDKDFSNDFIPYQYETTTSTVK